MIPHFFIDRPIFASVLSIVIVVLGLVALQGLPIAQFPEITPPVIQIDADYPGASAEVIADSVARPIEVQLPGIDNLLYYDSTSTNDGHMTIKLTFEIGTNVDIAQVQTQNRQKLAEPQLPPEVVRQGISVKKVSPDLLAVVALSSSDPTKDTVFISNYALLNVIDNLKRITWRRRRDSLRRTELLDAPDPGPDQDGATQPHAHRHCQCRPRTKSGLSSRDDRARTGAERHRTDDPGDHTRPSHGREGLRGDDRPGAPRRVDDPLERCRQDRAGRSIL